MYMIDDYDEDRDACLVGKFAPNILPTMQQWPALDPGADDPAGAMIATISRRPRGVSSTTIVNQLLPLEYDWLDVPGPDIAATRAARW